MLTSEAITPDRPREDAGPEFTRSLGRAQQCKREAHGVTIIAEHGLLAVRPALEGVIRIKLFAEAAAEDEPDMGTTAAVVGTKTGLPFAVKERDAAYVIETEGATVEIAKRDCAIRFFGGEGQLLACQSPMAWNDSKAVSARFASSEQTHYYGLGEKTGFLDKRGERYEMWNSDVYAPHVPEIEALYQSIPYLLVHEPRGAYGIFLDNPGRSCFDMRGEPDAFTIRTETGPFDYYWIAGPQLKDVVRRYTSLTGRMKLPPVWALGYHQSRYSYMTQDEVLRLARTFREKKIPCDAIYLDIHYMDGYRVFTFDPERFPDPKAMIAELKALGFRVVPIVDPGVKLDPGYRVYDEGAAEGMFCRKTDGEPFVGPVWPGMSVFPDFTEDRVQEWWGGLHRFYTDLGIEGIWNDMNEPAVFNDTKTMDTDTLHGNNGFPVTHGEVHNLYGLLMSKATAEGLERLLEGRRPFVLTRAGYAGIQRYAAVWTGDNRSFWEHLAMAMPMVLNLGLSGVPFSGPDVGGFAHHASGELLARWTQAGALFPFFRNHSELSSSRQEPWSFGPEIERICREAIRLRYRLMPYLYSLFREAAHTGLPVMRPLVLDYPDDPHAANLCDQFLVGERLLAAPIYRPATEHRVVYLPRGVWYDYWTGQKWEGGRHILAHAPLDTLPLFVKEGAIIPYVEPAESAASMESDVLYLDIHCSGAAYGVFELYEDDGLTFDYENGRYNLYRLAVQEADNTVKLDIGVLHAGFESRRSAWRLRLLHLPFVPRMPEGFDRAETAEALDGRRNAWYYDPSAGELTVVLPRPAESVAVTVHMAENES